MGMAEAKGVGEGTKVSAGRLASTPPPVGALVGPLAPGTVVGEEGLLLWQATVRQQTMMASLMMGRNVYLDKGAMERPLIKYPTIIARFDYAGKTRLNRD
jgi:hypothetical protein